MYRNHSVSFYKRPQLLSFKKQEKNNFTSVTSEQPSWNNRHVDLTY